MSGNALKKHMAAKAEKRRQAILRQLEIIDNLMAMLPKGQANRPEYRLLREVSRMIRDQQSDQPSSGGEKQ